MATVAKSVDPVCPLHEAAGRRQRHTRNPDHERYTVAPIANRKPQSVDARSNGRSGAPSHPATEVGGGNAARLEIHTTAETRSSELRTNPSTQCRRHGCAERSSSPAAVAA